MATLASPLFDRYFGRAPLPPDAVLPTPAAPGEVRLVWYPKQQAVPATAQTPAAQAAQPPTPPPPARPTSLGATPPEPSPQQTGQRRVLPEPPRRPKELDWLTCQLSEHLCKRTKEGLRETLRRRARTCGPLPPPTQPVARARFGLRGERLKPQTIPTLCDLLAVELRETVRTMEAPLSWSERNFRLVMHSARLGQLCADLERRGAVDVPAVIRAGLALL